MKPFYFHIGLPRCASTTIETEFLIEGNAGHDRLRAEGIKPLRALHDALRSQAGTQWDDQLLEQIHGKFIAPDIADPSAAGFFTSDEALTLTYSEEMTPPDLDARARALARLMIGTDPSLIMLVRNQPDYIVSLYGLHLQSGGSKEFPAFVNDLKLGALDWFAVAEAYAGVFGRDRIKVFPLEAECYAGGQAPYGDFIAAVQGVMGISRPLPLAEVKVYNPSLPTLMMPVQQQINAVVDPATARRIADIIRSSLKPGMVAKAYLLAPEQANHVRTAFARSNRALFEAYMPDFDATPYLPG